MAPLDTSVEALYTDGFILSETKLGDISPYNSSENILRAIINKDPETDHGRMIRFSVFYKDHRYDVDWTILPDNARPIRFRQGNKSFNLMGEDFWWSGCNFGYQYTDENGKNHQEIVEV